MQDEQTKQGTGAGGPDRLAELKAKVDDLAKLYQQLDASRTAAKRTRLGISMVILLIALGFAAVLYSIFSTFWNSEREPFLAELQARMLSTETGALHDAIAMVKDVAPVYEEEVKKQFGAEWPKIRAEITSQGNLLVTNLVGKDGMSGQATAKIKDRLTAMVKRQETRLRAEFKEITNDQSLDTVLGNVRTALEGAVTDVIKDRADKLKQRVLTAHDKILEFAPEGERESISERLEKALEQFLLYDTEGAKPKNP